MRRAAKVDSNQERIVTVLRQVGARVESLARVGGGVPDLLVLFRGRLLLLEVKTAAGSLTPDQVQWHQEWAGAIHIVHNVEEALTAIGAI